MAQLYEINVNLSENQKRKLSSAYKKRETIILGLTNNALSGNDTLYVPSNTVKRLGKNRRLKKGMEIKLAKTNCVRRRRRILIMSFLPNSLSRVLIVMPCDFSVWAPFWTDYVAHKASISCVIVFLAAVSWNLLPLEVPSRWKDCSHFRFSQFSTR